MTRLVAFTGLAGAGKSSAADALVEIGFVRVKFAGPLKAMLRAFYDEVGVPAKEVDRRLEGDLKAVGDPALSGQTPRHAMQTLGSEWGRALIHGDLWVAAWIARVGRELSSGRSVVVDDCRHENEAAAIRRFAGTVVEITGRGGIAGGHSSERGVASDETIENTGSIGALKTRVVLLYGGGSPDETE